MTTLRVKNVSDGIRYGWREHDPRAEKLRADIAALEAMKPKDVGETMGKRQELERLEKELGLLPIKLVMTLPDEIHEVPETSQAAFLKHLTDDWAMINERGEVVPWPPGTRVRATVKVTPRGLRADAMIEAKDDLADIRPDGSNRSRKAA